MRPAWSIIFFTTMSGLGLGLAGWVVIGLLPLMSREAVIGVGVITLALIGAGLVSSTFHLGHPERAWRALSQWRSSWLSREGVLAVVVMAGLAGVATLVLVWRRRYSMARWPAVVAVASVVSGWGVAQYPWLLVDHVTIRAAAGASATLQGLLVAVGLAVVLVLPPLIYLLRLTQTEEWTRH